MKNVYTSVDLRTHILALEAKSLRQKQDIKDTAGELLTSLKPVNLLKSAFSDTKAAAGNAIRSKGAGRNLLTGALSLAAGFLSKKIFVMGSSSIVKKALGTIVEVGVAKAVANNADKIASSGLKIINRVVK